MNNENKNPQDTPSEPGNVVSPGSSAPPNQPQTPTHPPVQPQPTAPTQNPVPATPLSTPPNAQPSVNPAPQPPQPTVSQQPQVTQAQPSPQHNQTHTQPIDFGKKQNKSSKKIAVIAAVLFLLVGGGVGALLLTSGDSEQANNEVSEETTTVTQSPNSEATQRNQTSTLDIEEDESNTEPETTVQQESTEEIPPTDELTALDEYDQAARSFILAIQDDSKSDADSYLSTKMKSELVQYFGEASYYEICKLDPFCGSYVWVDLDTAEVTSQDYTLGGSFSGKTYSYAVTTVVNGATSINTLEVSVVDENGTYLVDSLEQKFSGNSNSGG